MGAARLDEQEGNTLRSIMGSVGPATIMANINEQYKATNYRSAALAFSPTTQKPHNC